MLVRQLSKAKNPQKEFGIVVDVEGFRDLKCFLVFFSPWRNASNKNTNSSAHLKHKLRL